MRTRRLKSSLVKAFLVVILFLSISIGALGFYFVRNEIVKKSQQRLTQYIKAAEMLYNGEKEFIGQSLSLVRRADDLESVREKLGLDYLRLVEAPQFDIIDSRIARRAVRGERSSATRIIPFEEISKYAPGLIETIDIDIIDTPRARHRGTDRLEGLMAMEHARPFLDAGGEVAAVLYGGRVVNADDTLVNRIRDLVFEERMYRAKPVGTVTIFQNDVRIATNVLTESGERATGTRLSAAVYEKVLVKGQLWLDRAFVVNDWYLTAYEPLRDIDGNIIGILYVGMLQRPFDVLIRNVSLVFLLIMAGAVVLALAISVLMAGSITSPVRSVLDGIERLSDGDLDHRVPTDTPLEELNRLAVSFNNMAASLDRKNRELVEANTTMESLNRRYLDLIGFVSHELKGILASTILNAYSVRDGFLGMVNFKQQKALDSVTRNLDHLDGTVKNFLNLSRLEKGELTFVKKSVLLKEEIFDVAVDAFNKQMVEKGMVLKNDLEDDLGISADPSLMQVVANNLVSNAVKYGIEGGRINISAETSEGKVRIYVYNDGRVLTEEDMEQLFKRFARLDSPETRKAKGTGLGLFITKEIIERHGGRITVSPGEKGNTFIIEMDKGRVDVDT